MSYSKNVYLGWYVSFSKSQRRVAVGTETKRLCPTNSKHPNKDAFCSKCGAEIQTIETAKYYNYPSPHFILEMGADEIASETFGLVTQEDVKALKGSYVIFPEFIPGDKAILFAPGYTQLSDVSRSGGIIQEVNPNKNNITDEWLALVKKVFDVTDLTIHYGIVLEVY